MPEGAQMAQSDLRAGGIYFQNQNIHSQKRTSSIIICSLVNENPLTDGCYDKGLQVKYTLICVVLGRGLSLGGNV